MIDFRYHLVSIVAIFLALTVGIVLGSTVLQEPIINSAQATAESIKKVNQDQRDQISALQAREEGNSAFVANAAAELVKGDLTAEHVVVVEAPGAPSGLRDQVREMIELAGGTYTGRVALTEKFIAPEQAGVVEGLAAQLSPIGTVFPEGATPYDKAGQVLASALVTTASMQAGTVNTAASSVLDVFQEGGFISMSDDPAKRATLAVVVAPSTPYEGDTAEAQNGAVVSVAGALDNAAAGTVLAGTATASGTGGVIAALLDSGDEASQVSTVDTLDMPSGRVVLVYALREQHAGRAGAYGIGSGATAFEPTPSASPSPPASGG
ncbi:copper transporter [Acrocarpospora sp. B8E8]|uniref:copper transporter n=1 Tax=Acrocarpospora sp. B8E8 TaxID=3153572 RepID=UPI00325C507E